MTNTATRERFNAYMELYGAPQKFIADKVGLHAVTVNAWLHGKKELGKATLTRINSYIDNMARGNV